MIRKNLYFSAFILGVSAILTLFSSCSTKKNTFTRRTYHNLTAHYNGYFNGKEALKDAQNDLARISLDNYGKVLPIVNYGTKENITTITPSLDRAIAKASMVIQRHSIFIKSVEYVSWIEDCYMLMAKANFYKQDYKTAFSTFDFTQKRYKNSDIRYEAQLWMARCNIQTKDFDGAQSLLDDLQNKIDKKKAPGSLNRDLALAFAELHLQQENFGPAEEFLIKSLEYHHPKAQRARLRFILAQVEQKKGELSRASRNYLKVINMNPGYELSFNARINLAKCYDAGSGNSKEIVKNLKKMLRDEKNKDYQDQIYFALAEIAEKDGDSTLVVDYLKSSVATSTKNKYQRGISSLKLANIFYRQPQYPFAQAYYDTAVQSFPSDYPDLVTVKRRATILNDLVKYINIVDREDSLQRIAKMSEKERNVFIEKLIAKIQAEEQKKQKEESERMQGMSMLYRNNMNKPGGMNNQGGLNQQGGTGGWYFYNPSSVSYGFTEFEKKWGKRKLEDNWRLSDKEQVADFGDNPAASQVDSLAADSLKNISKDPKDKKTYLQNLPLTEAQMAKSTIKIKDALYNLGSIYYLGLSDFPQSVTAYETLLTRFPTDTLYYLKSCYNLYEECLEQDDKAKADHYKNLIISKFPDSDYAKIIKDPEYKKELAARRNKAANLYSQAWQAFENEQYNNVLNYCGQAKGATNDKQLITKFDYLQTISTGKLQGKDTMVLALRRFITKYPNSELKTLAQNILDKLVTKDSIALAPTKPGEKPKATQKDFFFNPEAIHLFLIIADIKKVNVNALKIKVSDHNLKYASLDNLSISSLYLDDSHQIMSVSNFSNKEKAMDYYTGILNNQYVFSSLQKEGYETFVITVDNYPILYKNKDVARYLEFFKEKYLP
ncbi:MAG: tetratricopeptide repeat protein [Bacteroidetes bacterium]|nr:tetratricopeptide repeat protein [Bacteroidota bacterium]